MEFTSQEEIDSLVSAPKTIVEPYRYRLKPEHGYWRDGFDLKSPDHDGSFRVFMRINASFEENFSIGLVYMFPSKGSIPLLRCNGPHGGYERQGKNYFASPSHDAHTNQYHIHPANLQNILEGRRAEQGGIPTTDYMTFEEALDFFLKKINVVGHLRFFPPAQVELPLSTGGES